MEASGIASTVTRVTVYAEGARVTRIARVPQPAGGVVRLAGLPLALDDGSVRVRARGAIAGGVRVALDAPGAADDLAPPDDAELDAAQLRADRAGAEVERLEEALADLELLAPPPRAEPDDGPRPDWSAALSARLALVELRGAREASLRAALAAAVRESDDADRAVAVVRDRAERASTARGARPHELRKAVRIELSAATDDVELEVEYLVPGARWAPTYVARLDGDTLRLEVRAVIAQRTGEDWRGVALSLSTAEAQRFTELPELPAAKIGRRQPAPPRTGWRAPPIGVDALYADWDRSFAALIDREPAVTEAPPPIVHEEIAAGRFDDAPSFGGMDAMRAIPPPQSSRPPGAVPDMMPMVMPSSMPMAKKGASPLRALGAIGGAAVGAVGALASVARSAGGGRREEMARSMPAPRQTSTTIMAPADDVLVHEELAAPADLLAFGELRLPGPRSPSRGKLVKISRRERYLAWLAAAVEIDVDVVALVDGAVREARAIAAPPPHVRAGWDTSYDYALIADGAIDVPSDGGWHAIALTAASAPATVRHVVVPREVTDVFRVAELTSPLDAPMLPGPMDVYDGKDFVLTTQVEWVPPRGAVVLGLGVDARVKVTRNSDFHEEAVGMLRGSLRLDHAVELTAENLGARAIALEVRERVPVPPDGEHDDVEVEVAEASPAWEAWQPEPRSPGAPVLRGGHRWRLSVDPGQRVDLRARYHIKIAGKHELIGGNRREP